MRWSHVSIHALSLAACTLGCTTSTGSSSSSTSSSSSSSSSGAGSSSRSSASSSNASSAGRSSSSALTSGSSGPLSSSRQPSSGTSQLSSSAPASSGSSATIGSSSAGGSSAPNSSSAAAASSSGTAPDTTPPVITQFAVDPDVFEAVLSYAATDATQPVSFVLVGGRGRAAVDALVPGSFAQATNMVVMPSTTSAGPFTHSNLVAGSVFYYRVEACDAAVPPNCSASTSAKAIIGYPHIQLSTGTPEKVWDYGDSACNTQPGEWDLPDVEVRAHRNHLNELLLVRGNAPHVFAMFGQTFAVTGPGALQTDCLAGPILNAGNYGSTTSAPWEYDHQEWLTSMYRLPASNRIHALVHNEYHDPRAASSPPCTAGDVLPSNPCWLNSILYMFSDDGGHTFTKPSRRLVATPPSPWDPQAVPNGQGGFTAPLYGYLSPSNIVAYGGHYYSLFMAITAPPASSTNTGVCLMRTDDPANAASWRAWDGTDFTLTMAAPYDATGNVVPTNVPACALLDHNVLGDLHGSLTFNTYLQKFLLVGATQRIDPDTSTLQCGFFFSVSTDLLNWSLPRLFKQVLLPNAQCGAPTGDGSEIYPSIIDHNQLTDVNDPNFERTGTSPHLYYTLWNQGVDRDLWRQPVTVCERGKPVNGLCP